MSNTISHSRRHHVSTSRFAAMGFNRLLPPQAPISRSCMPPPNSMTVREYVIPIPLSLPASPYTGRCAASLRLPTSSSLSAMSCLPTGFARTPLRLRSHPASAHATAGQRLIKTRDRQTEPCSSRCDLAFVAQNRFIALVLVIPFPLRAAVRCMRHRRRPLRHCAGCNADMSTPHQTTQPHLQRQQPASAL